MTSAPEAPDLAPASPSLTTVAMHGSFLNSLQWFLNKLATSGAMLVIAALLTPDEYGTASQSLAICQFLVILTPLTMGDVLIAHPKRFAALVPTARRVTIGIGLAMLLLGLASIPVMIRVYDKYPAAWLGGLLALLAFRPVLESLLVIPVSRLRLALEYRRIALIDGFTQLGVTALSLVMAALGGRAASLIVPQMVGAGARVATYARTDRAAGRGRYRKVIAAMLMRAYLPAAGAQYIHNLIVMLEILVLGYVSGDFQTGLFGFAFILAAQANSVIAFQLGVVLQPIFGRLQDDAVRQVNGFLRAQRVLGAVCVPISFFQVIVAEPLFRIAFAERWQPAVPVFQFISLAQAFYFATGPSMACLRAQRRFSVFFGWQGIQLVVAIPTYWLGAHWGGAAGVAVASGATWAISAPVAVWLCTRVMRPGRPWDAFMVFLRPWLFAAPIFVGGYFAIQWIARFGLLGDIAALVAVGPVTLLLALWVARRIDPELRGLSDTVFRAIWKRVKRS